MRLRGFGARTRKAYVGHVRRFLQSAEAAAGAEAGLPEALRSHLLRRTAEDGISRAYHDQLVSALRRFSELVLGRRVEDLPLVRPKKTHALPTVLSHGEVRRLLAAVRNPKHLALLALVYSAGLRVSEVVCLRPADLDLDRGLIRVRQGKGRKDRYTLLADGAQAAVAAYLERTHPGTWLFPGARPSRHLTTRSVQKIVEQRAPRSQASRRSSPSTPSATASPPTCWRPAPTCASSRSCWDTGAPAPPRSTPTSRTGS